LVKVVIKYKKQSAIVALRGIKIKLGKTKISAVL
jgi:hypothetical protein